MLFFHRCSCFSLLFLVWLFFSFALVFFWGLKLFGLVYKFSGPQFFFHFIKTDTMFALFQSSGMFVLHKFTMMV